MTSNKKTNKISTKNYIIALAFFVGVILFVLYIFEWYQVKQEEKLMDSYLVKTKTVNYVIDNLNTSKQVLQEAPSEYFIFIGYNNDEEEYNLEKEMKAVIDDYEINDIVYYLDVTDIHEKENFIAEINKTLNVNLSSVPALIYVNDGKIDKDTIIDSENDEVFNVNKFKKLLDVYEYTKKDE